MVSLSVLHSLRRTTARCSNGRFLILLDQSDLHRIELRLLSHITEEEAKNGDYDDVGEGIEVRHSSCIVYMSGIKDETNDTIFHTHLTDFRAFSIPYHPSSSLRHQIP